MSYDRSQLGIRTSFPLSGSGDAVLERAKQHLVANGYEEVRADSYIYFRRGKRKKGWAARTAAGDSSRVYVQLHSEPLASTLTLSYEVDTDMEPFITPAEERFWVNELIALKNAIDMKPASAGRLSKTGNGVMLPSLGYYGGYLLAAALAWAIPGGIGICAVWLLGMPAPVGIAISLLGALALMFWLIPGWDAMARRGLRRTEKENGVVVTAAKPRRLWRSLPKT